MLKYIIICIVMKNRIVILNRLLMATAMLIAMAAPASYASKERSFNAVSYQYNVTTSPQVSYRKFKSRVTINNNRGIRVIEIKNYVSKKSKPDGRITIAISGNDVGSAIYNNKNELVAEFGRGKRAGDSLYIFKQKEGENTIVASWFVDEDYIMSDYTITNSGDMLVYKETIIYSAKRPSRKKK